MNNCTKVIGIVLILVTSDMKPSEGGFAERRALLSTKRMEEDNQRTVRQQKIEESSGIVRWMKRKWDSLTHENETARDDRRKKEDEQLDMQENLSKIQEKRNSMISVLRNENITEQHFPGVTEFRVLMDESSTIEDRKAALEALKNKVQSDKPADLLTSKNLESFIQRTFRVSADQKQAVESEFQQISSEKKQEFMNVAAAWAQEEAIRMIEELQQKNYELTKPALIAGDVADIMGMVSLKSIFNRAVFNLQRFAGDLLATAMGYIIDLSVFAYRKARGTYKQVAANQKLIDSIKELFPFSYGRATQRRMLLFNPSKQ